MANRFRDKFMRITYEDGIFMYKTKHRNLFYQDGTQCRGNGIANMFWNGYNGITMGYWDAVSKTTAAYAYWRAGQDCKAEEVKTAGTSKHNS